MIKQILFTLSLVLTTASCAPKYVQVLDAETKKPIEGANCSFLLKGGNPFTPNYGRKEAITNKNG